MQSEAIFSALLFTRRATGHFLPYIKPIPCAVKAPPRGGLYADRGCAAVSLFAQSGCVSRLIKCFPRHFDNYATLTALTAERYTDAACYGSFLCSVN